jgi:hypothetical protein
VAALVPTPTLPSAYAFGETQPLEPLVINARQLPAIEPEPVLPESNRRSQPSVPGKTTWERLRTAEQ